MIKIILSVIGFALLYYPLAFLLASAIGRSLKAAGETETRPVLRLVSSR
jgi:hypothetical protein